MHKVMMIVAVAAPLAGLVLPAAAATGEQACTTQPVSKWISKTTAKTDAEALGYTVRSVKVENNCYDVFALDKSGKHVLAVMDPITGKIVNNESEGN
jgi:hypothetical protein